MNTTQRRAALDILGWSQRRFAARIGYDESTVRRWFRDGADVPSWLDPWLKRRARAMEADPPQISEPRGPGRPRKPTEGKPA